jgi:hypothetical protein
LHNHLILHTQCSIDAQHGWGEEGREESREPHNSSSKGDRRQRRSRVIYEYLSNSSTVHWTWRRMGEQDSGAKSLARMKPGRGDSSVLMPEKSAALPQDRKASKPIPPRAHTTFLPCSRGKRVVARSVGYQLGGPTSPRSSSKHGSIASRAARFHEPRDSLPGCGSLAGQRLWRTESPTSSRSIATVNLRGRFPGLFHHAARRPSRTIGQLLPEFARLVRVREGAPHSSR